MVKLSHLVFFAALLVCSAAVCTRTGSDEEVEAAANFKLDADLAMSDLRFFTAAAHPFGSEYQKEVGDFLMQRAKAEGAMVVRAQEFAAATPNPAALEQSDGPRPLTLEKNGRNILAALSYPANRCWILVGSHYDTKIIPGIDYRGANDSGSSSVLLLQLIRYFAQKAINPGCNLLFIWFDGEEPVLSDWTTGESAHPAKIQDNTYGSRHFVDQLESCEAQKCYRGFPLKALILIDMVGMPDIRISRDAQSTPELLELMISSAGDLGLSQHIASRQVAIEDDHTPFLKAAIPSLNIINFEDLSVWHREGDELSVISPKSMEIAGQIATLVILRLKTLPKGI